MTQTTFIGQITAPRTLTLIANEPFEKDGDLSPCFDMTTDEYGSVTLESDTKVLSADTRLRGKIDTFEATQLKRAIEELLVGPSGFTIYFPMRNTVPSGSSLTFKVSKDVYGNCSFTLYRCDNEQEAVMFDITQREWFTYAILIEQLVSPHKALANAG